MTTTMFYFLLAFLSMATALQAVHPKAERPLRVETFVHQDVSLNMVSSLIIGSEAAVLIDLPLSISSAKSLITWVKEKTQKPVVALFTTHNHPDHYLGARTCLDAFPNATFYANPEVSKWITIGAPLTVSPARYL
jgi:glyoxylase-like metal-dependent hydrolase (beta-lactamase superfamily II)